MLLTPRMNYSAGAMSVSSHLLAYGLTSTPLFRAGILQSGSPTTENYKSVNDSKPAYDSILKAAGCSNSTGSALACLRGLSADAFNSSVVGTSWMPAIDGDFVPAYPSKQLEEGKFVQVPLLLGGEPRRPSSPYDDEKLTLNTLSSGLICIANSDEGTAFGVRGINTTEQLKSALIGRYTYLSNSSIDKILELYPDDPSIGSPYNTGDGYLSTGLQDKVSSLSSHVSPRSKISALTCARCFHRGCVVITSQAHTSSIADDLSTLAELLHLRRHQHGRPSSSSRRTRKFTEPRLLVPL